jgi:hypothetical protein
MSSELLKQAIADAKAVRATALANAKAALEEAFAPKLQSMLATKLQQEVEGEDEPVTDEVPVADPAFDAASADEAPIEPSTEGDVAPAADIAPEADLPLDDAAPAPEDDVAVGAPEIAPVDGDEEIDELSLGAGHPDPVDQTDELTESDDADYKKTTTGVKTDDPQGASKEFSAGPGKADKNVTAGEPKEKTGSKNTIKRDVASISDDPQGASKEFSAGPGKADKDQTGKVLEENDDEISDQSLDEILKELESEVNAVTDDVTSPEPEEVVPVEEVAPAAGADEEIDLDELLAEDEDKDDEDKDKDDEDDEKDDNKPDFLKENKNLKAELLEYRKAVEFLRSRINEVNLLNAKLLYTNRLFKAAGLTKEQKIKVIESFDLTKSVREAKIVYTTLAESLNFGAKKVATPAAKPVVKRAVKAITEGLASKVVASTKPSKSVVLTEGAEMASRFQKLAGITKK